MKKRTITALMLIGALALSSCSKAPVEETTEETTITEETTTVSETTAAATPTPTPRPTLTPTPRPTATPTPTPDPTGDPITSDDDQYPIIMGFVDELEASAPGEYRYIIFSRSSDNDAYWVLAVFGDNTSEAYIVVDGEMVETAMPANYHYSADEALTYDELKSFPCLISESDRPSTDAEYPDSLADGTYVGSIIAMSEDGTRLYMYVSEVVAFDRSFAESLQVGDSIGCSVNGQELTVTDIGTETDENGEEQLLYVSLSNSCHLNPYPGIGDDDTFVLWRYSCPYFEERYVVELPVSPSCEVTDTFDVLVELPEYADQVPTGNPLLDSYWWYVHSGDSYVPALYSNGWYQCSGLLFPVEVRNGEIVRVNIEWR